MALVFTLFCTLKFQSVNFLKLKFISVEFYTKLWLQILITIKCLPQRFVIKCVLQNHSTVKNCFVISKFKATW